MPGAIVRQYTPEETELLHKRSELASLRTTLAERELELTDLNNELAAFKGRYLRQVGILYAELDDWDARVAQLAASLEGSSAARQRAERARKRAQESYEAAHGEASKAEDFSPSTDLKSLFREAAKRIHPDFAKNSADRERRNRFMAEANAAYRKGDTEALQRILDEHREGNELESGEGIAAELVRVIRQIAQAKGRIQEIDRQFASLHDSEIAKLQREVEVAGQQGRDLLAELAAAVSEQVARARKEYETLVQEARNRGRQV